MNTAVVLMSGGMDSAVCASIAKSQGYEIAALHANYGQKTEKRELEAFSELCRYFKAAEKLEIDLSYLAKIGCSSLTDKKVKITNADLTSKEIPSSYVPFRNGAILSIAAGWAETVGARAIFIGASQVDCSGYPDCRESFLQAFEKAVDLGTKPETNIRIIAPLLNMTKKEVILKGAELETPFELTWSCYKNSEKACGKCDSCALRLRGFKESGLEDPLPYEEKPDYA